MLGTLCTKCLLRLAELNGQVSKRLQLLERRIQQRVLLQTFITGFDEAGVRDLQCWHVSTPVETLCVASVGQRAYLTAER